MEGVVVRKRRKGIYILPNLFTLAALFGGSLDITYIGPNPTINAYKRLGPDTMAPHRSSWGYDNRTCGLRVPPSNTANRRLENRIPSSDANPYLAIAATLAAGYLGMVEGLTPTPAVDADASLRGIELPRSLSESLSLFAAATPLVEILGPVFCEAYRRVKEAEYETFMRTISPWEREFLLLNV